MSIPLSIKAVKVKPKIGALKRRAAFLFWFFRLVYRITVSHGCPADHPGQKAGDPNPKQKPPNPHKPVGMRRKSRFIGESKKKLITKARKDPG